MQNKSYTAPEIKITHINADVITDSYIEDEEWTGPEIGFSADGGDQ